MIRNKTQITKRKKAMLITFWVPVGMRPRNSFEKLLLKYLIVILGYYKNLALSLQKQVWCYFIKSIGWKGNHSPAKRDTTSQRQIKCHSDITGKNSQSKITSWVASLMIPKGWNLDFKL